MRKILLFCLSIPVFLLGCAEAPRRLTNLEIMQLADSVNTTDGVDKIEALILAQRYAIQKGLQAEHRIDKAVVAGIHRTKNAWRVDVPSIYSYVTREDADYNTLELWVDAKTGTVSTGQSRVSKQSYTASPAE